MPRLFTLLGTLALSCAFEEPWVLRRTALVPSSTDGGASEPDGGAVSIDLLRDLRARYSFDEADGGRRATDISGNSLHGELSGAAVCPAKDGGRPCSAQIAAYSCPT
jgi:hypothetical protein